MKTKSTGIWLIIAVLLFAAIWLVQRLGRGGQAATSGLLPELHAASVTGVEIIPLGALAIDAQLTNGVWQLEKPFVYPARAAAIEDLISRLENLAPAARLSAVEIGADKNADAEYGFDNPQYSLQISAGEQQWQLRVGKKTAPGDQVFVRVVGVDGAFVTDANWLQLLPADASAWRDTSLFTGLTGLDLIEITNGVKAIELQRDPTNHLWRMTRPLDARADNEKITTALEQLRATQITGFVNDDPKADLTAYGLQPANLALWLGNETNLSAAIQLGKAVPENPLLVYAHRAGWNSIVTVTNDQFATWRGAVNDFRDPHLLEITSPVAQISVGGPNPFTLKAGASNNWQIAGQTFAVDLASVGDLVRFIAGWRVKEFVKDNNTPTDLQGFGLGDPSATNQLTLYQTAGDTNQTITQILFGNTDTNLNLVYVKRADENSVYGLGLEDYKRLKDEEFAWAFRDRKIWDFSETNVVQITLHQNGKTRTLLRQGVNLWTLGAASQGMINPPALEETAHRLGQLTAVGWLGPNFPVSEAGFNPGNLQITIELKSGEKLSVEFGLEVPRANTALAAVTLDNERWAFVFPPVVYQFVATYLTIPQDAP
jgi:hypothetical protein